MEYLLYLVFVCIVSNNKLEGRSVQAIIGRNVSFSYTLSNATRDVFKIFHNKTLLLWIWPKTKFFVLPEKEEKVRFSEYMSAGETFTVNITLLNITKDDVGTYTVSGKRNSQDFNYSVVLRAVEKEMIPRIDIVRYTTSNTSLVLQCLSSSSSEGKFHWKLNTSLIQKNSRYSDNNIYLLIQNVTADDQYSSFTCMELESAIESDPYKIKLSGPSVITFTTNALEIIEHESVNVSCNSDCNPICTWQWTTANPLSVPDEPMSSENTLEIKNITRRDAGNYTCTIHNVLSGAVMANHLTLDVISWSKAGIERPGAVLRLSNEKDGGNLTCFARNAKNANTTIYHTMRIKLKSGIKYDMTTSKSIEEDTDSHSLPSVHLLLYIAFGLGAMFAIGFFTCVLQKSFKCLRKDKIPNNIPLHNIGENKSAEGNQAESYWTIVSNTKGEMSTALETNITEIHEPSPDCNMTVAEMNHLEASQLHRVKVDLEIDGYIHPIH